MNRITPNYAPDGFSGVTQQFPARHGNATGEKTSPAGAVTSRGAPMREAHTPNHQDGYDEGLVHSHGWACSR